MSDIGLGNLTELKGQVLAESLRQGTDFDTALSSIGQGVAAAFDRFCNRTFSRGEGVTETFTADRTFYYVKRYPLESVSAVALKTSDSDGFVAQTVADFIEVSHLQFGRLYFGYEPGTWADEIRITYTGGYWFDTTENETGSLPANATQLPNDIKHAWLLQCRHVWDSVDRLGSGIAKDPGTASILNAYDLVPEVRNILTRYIRYAT